MFLYYAIHIKKNNENFFAKQDICATFYLKNVSNDSSFAQIFFSNMRR